MYAHVARLRDGVLAAAVLLSACGIAGCGMQSFRASEVVVLTVDASLADRLVLDNPVGSVRVSADLLSRTVTARVTKIGKGTSPAEAQAALSEIDVTLTATPQGVEARVHHPRDCATRSWETAWELSAPHDLGLALQTGVGNIAARDFGNGASVSSGVGNVTLANVRGGVAASVGVGNIRAEGIEGEALLQVDVGDVRLTCASPSVWPVRAVSSVGSVHVELAGEQRGRLTARTGVGDVRLDAGTAPVTNLHHTLHAIQGDLHGVDKPTLEFASSVGDVTVWAR